MGYRKCCHECSLDVYLVIDILYLLVLYPCITFDSNRTIYYGDIAFKRFRGYSVVTNAVVLTGYLPSYKVVMQCIGN